MLPSLLLTLASSEVRARRERVPLPDHADA